MEESISLGALDLSNPILCGLAGARHYCDLTSTDHAVYLTFSHYDFTIFRQICGFLPTCNIVQLVVVKLWSGEIRSVRRVLPHGSVSISLPCIYLADYLIQSTPRPHLFALPWVEGKLVFARVYKGFLVTVGSPV